MHLAAAYLKLKKNSLKNVMPVRDSESSGGKLKTDEDFCLAVVDVLQHFEQEPLQTSIKI